MNLKNPHKFKKSIFRKLSVATFIRYWMPVWNQSSSEARNEMVRLDHDLHAITYIRIHNTLRDELRQVN